jgi:hypothetical protein
MTRNSIWLFDIMAAQNPLPPLSMSQTKEELLRHLGMSSDMYALMAVRLPFILEFTLLIINIPFGMTPPSADSTPIPLRYFPAYQHNLHGP